MNRPKVEEGPRFYAKGWDGRFFCPRLPLRVSDLDGHAYWLGPGGARWTDAEVNADVERQLQEFLLAKEAV